MKKLCFLLVGSLLLSCVACNKHETTGDTTKQINLTFEHQEEFIEETTTSSVDESNIIYLDNLTAEEIVDLLYQYRDNYPIEGDSLENNGEYIVRGHIEDSHDYIYSVHYALEEQMDRKIHVPNDYNKFVSIDLRIYDYDKASKVYELLVSQFKEQYKFVEETKGAHEWLLTRNVQDMQHYHLVSLSDCDGITYLLTVLFQFAEETNSDENQQGKTIPVPGET